MNITSHGPQLCWRRWRPFKTMWWDGWLATSWVIEFPSQDWRLSLSLMTSLPKSKEENSYGSATWNEVPYRLKPSPKASSQVVGNVGALPDNGYKTSLARHKNQWLNFAQSQQIEQNGEDCAIKVPNQHILLYFCTILYFSTYHCILESITVSIYLCIVSLSNHYYHCEFHIYFP